MLFKINQRETKHRVLDFFQTDFYYLEAMAGIKARDILPSTKMAPKQIKTKEDARAELAVIRECLSRIHNGDGDYLSVRFLDGRSASEAAAYLNVSQSTYTEHLTRAADESRHRRQLETARQKRRGHLAWASMILLVIVCLIFMIGSFYLILKGHKIIGSIFGASSFLALIGSFMSNINELSGNDDIAKQTQNKNND